jgi:hypothetical protein
VLKISKPAAGACKGHETRLYSLPEAARAITVNQWGTPVDGIHSETLRRQWRDTGAKHGQRIGRDVWFSVQDIEDMGYGMTVATKDYADIGRVIEIILEDD